MTASPAGTAIRQSRQMLLMMNPPSRFHFTHSPRWSECAVGRRRTAGGAPKKICDGCDRWDERSGFDGGAPGILGAAARRGHDAGMVLLPALAAVGHLTERDRAQQRLAGRNRPQTVMARVDGHRELL